MADDASQSQPEIEAAPEARKSVDSAMSGSAAMPDAAAEAQPEHEQEKEGAEAPPQDNSNLPFQLKSLQADKAKLESQYRNLLGKLSSMRDTLGEKLKEDAEELDRREVQINSLTNVTSQQDSRIAQVESTLQEQEERNAQLSGELSTLRARLSTSEKASTDEASHLQQRLRDLEKVLDRVKGEKEGWQAQADEEHLRCEDALDSNRELVDELEALRREHRAVSGDLGESEKALQNVEGLLSEAQLANQKDFDEMRQYYEAQIRELKDKNEEQRRQVADAKASLELFRQDAERTPELEQECKEKTLLIGKVRHEAVILNEHLTEALKRLKEYNTSDSVDRQLMSNILLQFVTTPRSDGKRFEMLSLLASILNWNQYEREQAGIVPKSSKYPIPSSPGSPSSSYFRRSSSRPRSANLNGEDNASFGQLFVEFLLKETGQNSRNSTEQQPWSSPRSDVVLPPSMSSPDLRVLPPTEDVKGDSEKQ